MTNAPVPRQTGLPRPEFWHVAVRLGGQFPTVAVEDVFRVLIDARHGVQLFGLSCEDEADMAEKIAAEQLKQLVGESSALASPRLDPERHATRIGRHATDLLIATD